MPLGSPMRAGVWMTCLSASLVAAAVVASVTDVALPAPACTPEPRAHCARADLAGVDWRGANLARADLRGADLRGARLEGANLTGADLTGAWLAGAHLRRASLVSARLNSATLRAADLRDARMGRTKLRRAGLDGARLARPTSALPTCGPPISRRLTSGVRTSGGPPWPVRRSIGPISSAPGSPTRCSQV